MTTPLALPDLANDEGAPAMAGEPINVSSSDWTPTTPGATCTRWLIVGTAGTVVFDTQLQTSVTLYLPAGVWKIATTKVHMAGTNAGNLGALY
jgi:hypothetical protein